ncbi:hypothetical protein SAMN04489803_4345 [Pseudomonas chlororaphis]|nr:hypothetical protein SAMN04489803_4345 [Pseudomonas chlororaphis]
MEANDNAGHLKHRVVLMFFASKLAPTRAGLQPQMPARNTLAGNASPRSTLAATASIKAVNW